MKKYLPNKTNNKCLILLQVKIINKVIFKDIYIAKNDKLNQLRVVKKVI